MSWRLLCVLSLVLPLSGCFTELVVDAIKDAGRKPVRRVQTHPTALERVERAVDGRYFITAMYSDQVRRQFVHEIYESEGAWPAPGVRPRQLKSYPKTHAFPSGSTPIAVWSTSNQPAGQCVRLSGSMLQLREGNAEFGNLASFPKYWRSEAGPRTAISYFNQVCLFVFALPVAVAGDLATVGVFLLANTNGPLPSCR